MEENRAREEETVRREDAGRMGDHSKIFADTGAGVGKTKRVTGQGTADTRNDIMLYAVVEAESHDAAARSFEGHPHLQIPQSSIEIMEINPLHGM